MPIERLTKRFVDSLQPSARRVVYYDADLKGFGFLTGGEIMHLAHPAGIANHAIPLANLAGKEHKRSRAGKGFERSTRLRHWRQFEAKRGKALRNDPAHDDAPSIAAAG